MFSSLYQKVLTWARHKHAVYYLAVLSFAESSFFPIPPDVMLAPMAFANRKRAWLLATVTTVASVLGGVFGYLLGHYAFEPLVLPLIQYFGYEHHFEQAEEWFKHYGVWIVFVAGFSPIPYKVFTIAAGVMNMALLPFVLASILGRGARFYLVCALIVWGGQKLEDHLKEYIDLIGWITVALIVLAGLIAWFI
ncbi:MAG: YqaA family protein [Gammaproteobacteria bacterium]|jgi:membrane protein YqaA with SNARE-associated domain